MKFLIVTASLFTVCLIISKLYKKGTFIKRFITPFNGLFSAILLAVIFLPIGFLWDVGKSIKELKGIKILKSFWRLIKEILLVFSYIAGRIAIGIDIMGNVIAGEFIEDIITDKEDTLFGKSGITISASTGHLEKNGWLNKTGIWFTKQLSRVFGHNHSILAYEDWSIDNQKPKRDSAIYVGKDKLNDNTK